MPNIPESVHNLINIGIAPDDARALRRVAMTLHRWHEGECGTESGHIEREGEDGDGKPFWVPSDRAGSFVRARRYPIPDRERGALKRLSAIMGRYSLLGYYVQGDPRGAALYVLRPGDVREGESVDTCYSRGVAVYQ